MASSDTTDVIIVERHEMIPQRHFARLSGPIAMRQGSPRPRHGLRSLARRLGVRPTEVWKERRAYRRSRDARTRLLRGPCTSAISRGAAPTCAESIRVVRVFECKDGRGACEELGGLKIAGCLSRHDAAIAFRSRSRTL
jgi:hypothetical protein